MPGVGTWNVREMFRNNKALRLLIIWTWLWPAHTRLRTSSARFNQNQYISVFLKGFKKGSLVP